MNSFYAASAAACIGLIAAAGCSVGDDLFSQGDALPGSGGASSSSSSSDSSSSNSSSSSSSSNGNPSSSNTGAAGPTTTTSTGGDTGAGGDGTGAGPGSGTLDCGPGLTCDLDTSACCWDQHEQHGDPQAECVGLDPDTDGCTTGYESSGGYETRIECQSEAHCDGGDVCCARIAYSPMLNNNVYVELHCAEANDCDSFGGGFRGIVVCDDLGSTDKCPIIENPQGPGQIQSVCKDSALLPDGYLICGTP